jgi:hypothetical protein
MLVGSTNSGRNREGPSLLDSLCDGCDFDYVTRVLLLAATGRTRRCYAGQSLGR